MQTVDALIGSESVLLGVLVTHWDNLRLSEDFVHVGPLPLLLTQQGANFLATRIPDDNQLEHLEPGSKTNGAKAYTQLAEELLAYGTSNEP